MSRKSLVSEYMTRNVISVHPETPNKEIIEKMKETGHDGYPVVNDNEEIEGMITAIDLLLKGSDDLVKDIMSDKVVVAQQDMSINDAARVMFRHGISRLPVVDKDGRVQGIFTNTDMVRSHIERSTPTKVESYKKTLEQLYPIKPVVEKKKVKIADLKPTQDKIYADELEGRTYELKMGLAEPAIVTKAGNRLILVDGHHRAIAAIKLGYKEIDAYVIDIKSDIKLGMEKTAENNGINTFSDIKIIDDDQHPLIAITEPIRNKNVE
jgi:IMP dehydrogenase